MTERAVTNLRRAGISVLACMLLVRSAWGQYGSPYPGTIPPTTWPDASANMGAGIQPFDPYALPPTSLPPSYPPVSYPPPVAPLPNTAPLPTVPPFGDPAPATLAPPPTTQPIAPPPQNNYAAPVNAPTINFGNAVPRRGWVAGYEGAILDPRFSRQTLGPRAGLIPFLGEPPLGQLPDDATRQQVVQGATDYDLGLSSRVWVGYMGQQGFGGRVRWWYLNNNAAGGEATVGDITQRLQTDIRFNVLDFEATQIGVFQTWELEVAGGVRYGMIEEGLHYTLSDSVFGNDRILTGSDTYDFSGIGPTIGLSLRRPLGNWQGVTFIAKTRYSFLFGETNVTTDATAVGGDLFDPTDLDFDETLTAWEISVGAAWTRRLQQGMIITLGGFLEGQVWNPGNLGLFGPTFHVSVSR